MRPRLMKTLERLTKAQEAKQAAAQAQEQLSIEKMQTEQAEKQATEPAENSKQTETAQSNN